MWVCWCGTVAMGVNLSEFEELRKLQVDLHHGLIAQMDGILHEIHSNPASGSVFMILTESSTYMSSFRYYCSNSACERSESPHQLTLSMLWSCPTITHSSSANSNFLSPSSCRCVSNLTALRCFRAYSNRSKVKFQQVATFLGIKLIVKRRSDKISFQAGRTFVVEWTILKATLWSWVQED